MGLVRRAGVSLEDGPAGGGTDPAAADALLDDRAEVRLRAAAELTAQLGRDPSGTASAAAVPALLSAWEREDVPAVRQALLTALSRADRPEVGRALAAGLRVEDASARNAVVRALQEMPVAVEAVAEELLADADRDVRVLAVMVLSALPHPGVPGWLGPVVARDEDAAVVAAAVDVAVTLDAGLAADLSALASARFPHDPYLSFLADLADLADSAAST